MNIKEIMETFREKELEPIKLKKTRNKTKTQQLNRLNQIIEKFKES